jgi:heme exporter protein CcmD
VNEFFLMDGYAAYVWSAYGITLAVLIWNVWSAGRLRKQNLERARRATDPEEPGRQATVRQIQ